MKRRAFIGILGSAAAAWPLRVSAQQARPIKIGVLVYANPEPFWSMFREALRELGYVEGRNVQFEYKLADGNVALVNEHAAELVRNRVDIIVASLTPAALAAKQATADIPIVMAGAGDPVATGLVSSLASPGGNVTGLSATAAELGGKLLEILREIYPPLQRVAVLANAADTFTKPFVEQIELGGRTLGLAVQIIPVHGVQEFDAAFASMAQGRADALIVQPSLPRRTAIELALKHRLPTVSPVRSFPIEGGLVSYSANQADTFRRAAVYVDRVLKGDKPANLPVEQPTKFDLVINLKTAKALGLSIAPTLLARAEEVIE
jgi:putative tryptophan/tyrosine transport system substrate-binding protein